jgi:hypothetical protein
MFRIFRSPETMEIFLIPPSFFNSICARRAYHICFMSLDEHGRVRIQCNQGEKHGTPPASIPWFPRKTEPAPLIARAARLDPARTGEPGHDHAADARVSVASIPVAIHPGVPEARRFCGRSNRRQVAGAFSARLKRIEVVDTSQAW